MGGGIAGLSAAYQLQKQGRSFLLLEKTGRLGGMIRSERKEGFLLEYGPNSFLTSHETLMETAKELGILGQLLPAQDACKKRYVREDKNLQLVPMSFGSFLKTPLLSVRGKFRLFLEPWIPRKKGGREETVADFVSRRLGKNALNLVTPLIRGIYAGDPYQISMEAIAPEWVEKEEKHGSLFKALLKNRSSSPRPKMYSFQGGMETLVHALVKTVKTSCQVCCTLTGLKKEEGHWVIQWEQNGKIEIQKTRTIISALPAYEAAKLFKPFISDGAALEQVQYLPMAVLHLGTKQNTCINTLDGFGFLSGVHDNSFLLGCLWSSSAFRNRAPESETLLTCFAGGSVHPEILKYSDEELTEKGEKDLNGLLFSTPKTTLTQLTKHTRAIPQYSLGHRRRITKLQNELEEQHNIFLVGNYVDGISVNATMKQAITTVKSMYAAT